MKHLKDIIVESFFDYEIDSSKFTKTIEKEIKQFLKDNYKGRYSISKNPDTDGKYVVDSKGNIEIKNKNITNLTNGCFVWGKVDGKFDCSYCGSLTSLEGAPEKVGGDFVCYWCTSLTSLKGAPEKVGGKFDCCDCVSLTSLEGIPEEIDWDFICRECKSLTSLKGAPEKVDGYFICYDCGVKFTKDDVRKVAIVKKEIIC